MKMKQTLCSLVLGATIAAFALPAAACHNSYMGCKMKGGVMFNQNDGKYYRVPGKCAMVYRGVDYKLVPVATYKHVAGVKCEPRAGYWWNTTWMAPSQECYYMMR